MLFVSLSVAAPPKKQPKPEEKQQEIQWDPAECIVHESSLDSESQVGTRACKVSDRIQIDEAADQVTINPDLKDKDDESVVTQQTNELDVLK